LEQHSGLFINLNLSSKTVASKTENHIQVPACAARS